MGWRGKKPEVKILGAYCWRKRNIFHKKKLTWIQVKTWGCPSLNNNYNCSIFVCLFGFLTYSSTTRSYRGQTPRQSVWQFYVLPHMRQSWETMTSVSAGHIILTPAQTVGSGWPQRESNPGPPHQDWATAPPTIARYKHMYSKHWKKLWKTKMFSFFPFIYIRWSNREHSFVCSRSVLTSSFKRLKMETKERKMRRVDTGLTLNIGNLSRPKNISIWCELTLNAVAPIIRQIFFIIFRFPHKGI